MLGAFFNTLLYTFNNRGQHVKLKSDFQERLVIFYLFVSSQMHVLFQASLIFNSSVSIYLKMTRPLFYILLSCVLVLSTIFQIC